MNEGQREVRDQALRNALADATCVVCTEEYCNDGDGLKSAHLLACRAHTLCGECVARLVPAYRGLAECPVCREVLIAPAVVVPHIATLGSQLQRVMRASEAAIRALNAKFERLQDAHVQLIGARYKQDKELATARREIDRLRDLMDHPVVYYGRQGAQQPFDNEYNGGAREGADEDEEEEAEEHSHNSEYGALDEAFCDEAEEEQVSEDDASDGQREAGETATDGEEDGEQTGGFAQEEEATTEDEEAPEGAAHAHTDSPLECYGNIRYVSSRQCKGRRAGSLSISATQLNFTTIRHGEIDVPLGWILKGTRDGAKAVFSLAAPPDTDWREFIAEFATADQAKDLLRLMREVTGASMTID